MARAEAVVTLRIGDIPLVGDMAIAIGQVRLIHARNVRFPHFCVNCRAPYPCRTVLALDAVGDPPEPCGCTPTQECDRHYLDADRAFERKQDV